MTPDIDLSDVQSATRDPLFEPPPDWTTRPIVESKSPIEFSRRWIATELQQYGYVVINLGPMQLAGLEEGMIDIAQRLGLGRPFVPDLYSTRSMHRDSGMHLIGALQPAKDVRAFAGSAAQALHTDGTLEPLGCVQTTILGCVERAWEGGATVLFNAVGAFWDLWNHDRAVASALRWERCLERAATLDPERPPARGPAFGVVDGQLLTRYSRTPGDRYYSRTGKERELKKALDYLSSLARTDSGFYREVVLSSGQVLVLANSRLSHGRLAYRDCTATPSRLLLRALFRGSPAIRPIDQAARHE